MSSLRGTRTTGPSKLDPASSLRAPRTTDPDAVFAALADPTRREVIGRLAREPLSASALAGELPISRQAVAKHLATLDRAGLVATRRAGRELQYRLEPAPLGDAMAWMASVGARWDERLARLAARAERER